MARVKFLSSDVVVVSPSAEDPHLVLTAHRGYESCQTIQHSDASCLFISHLEDSFQLTSIKYEVWQRVWPGQRPLSYSTMCGLNR